MSFRYVFRDVDEQLIAILEIEQPIAHLAIGTNIVLTRDVYASEQETWLRVEHIMVGVTSGARSVQDAVGVTCSLQSTKSTTVAQGHTPNSYQDMIENKALGARVMA